MGVFVTIGPCDCENTYPDAIQEKTCRAIETRLLHWRSRLPNDIGAVPHELVEHELVLVEGHRITFVTLKRVVRTGDTLVVLQALVHTWSRPTFFSIGAVGRMYAEGILVSQNGDVQAAPRELMRIFR